MLFFAIVLGAFIASPLLGIKTRYMAEERDKQTAREVVEAYKRRVL
jgi:hypothetical protein